MKNVLSVTVASLLSCAAATGCGILSPEEEPERVIVSGIVYLNEEPAAGLVMELAYLRPGCALFCDLVSEEIITATTAADGTYRLEAEDRDGGWSCDTRLFVSVADYFFTSRELTGCRTHQGVDFRILE